MLAWFVSNEVAKAVLEDSKQLIQETDVEVMPENLPDAILDENVDVHVIRWYFSNDAWLLVKDVVARKKSNPVYTCNDCSHDLHESNPSSVTTA